jgi:nucleotide-binding universal stress UspA family protein
MSLRDILVHIDDTPQCDRRFKLALKLARKNDAELFALFTRADANLMGISTQVEKNRKQYKKMADAAHKQFQKQADKDSVSLNWQTAPYPASDDEVTNQLLYYTQHMDIAIVGQHDPANAISSVPPDLAERLVLESGRPVLVIPHAGEFKSVGKRVMVAWNTGRESVRALNDALPLMQGAKKVHILAIDPRRKGKRHGSVPSADIAGHLHRHGIKAQAEYINTKGMDASNTLLSLAADESIDLLVMGAYGHHPFRELILGGMTRDILRHMTVPVLMSH